MRTPIAFAVAFACTAAAGACPAEAAIQLQPVLTGLSSPVFVTSARDGSQRLFIVERGGAIKVLAAGATSTTTFLDIGGRVRAGGEQGLLGLAFHPQFSGNGRFFVDYTRASDGATVIAEYHLSASDPSVADDLAETQLLVIPQPFANHNGGMLAFGPDGYLYIGMGDGGSANDPGNRAQDVDELLGKILRIDVDPADANQPYASPPTNPFFGATAGRDEIYALGLRNPWRFSFDRGTGQLYVGDVGQGAVEEVDIVTAGGNYGWRIWEGTSCTGNDASLCSTEGFVFPIAQYGHTAGRCSITGGYVYRGTTGVLPAGAYVYGDYCTGEIFVLASGSSSVALDTGLNISSFGEDEAGELYVVGLAGTVDRIVAAGTQCTFTMSASSRSVPVGGVRDAVTGVTAAAGCTWTAISNDSWIAITSSPGQTGNGTVVFSVEPNFGSTAPRTGTMTIAGRAFTVTEAGCGYVLSGTSRSVPVGGVTNTSAGVSAPAGCAWTAASNDAWISVTSGQSGNGSGQVVFSVANNFAGATARTGSLTIAGRALTVTQPACTFTLGATARSVPVSGVQGAAVGVGAPAGCPWTAASNADWITITSGRSGSGNGQVVFSAADNFAGAAVRTGTLTIAGRTFTVTEAACAFTVSPTTRSVPVGGVQGAAVGVGAPAGCPWTATSNATWVTVTSGQNGSGNGQVLFSVAPNQQSTATRTGTLTVAGRTVTVTEAGCTFTLSATGRSVAGAGIQGSAIGVGASAGCGWTAVSNATWVTITAGQSGSGNGQVVFSVAPNPATAARTGTLTIAGKTFTVTESPGSP